MEKGGREAPPGPHELGLGDLLVWDWGTPAGLEGTAWDPILGSFTSWLWRLVLTFSFANVGGI